MKNGVSVSEFDAKKGKPGKGTSTPQGALTLGRSSRSEDAPLPFAKKGGNPFSKKSGKKRKTKAKAALKAV